MRKSILYQIIIAMAMVPAIAIVADNTVGADDVPWEEETAVEEVAADSTAISKGAEEDNNLYDLQGRQVTTPQPGKIYIYRGKKILWTSK